MNETYQSLSRSISRYSYAVAISALAMTALVHAQPAQADELAVPEAPAPAAISQPRDDSPHFVGTQPVTRWNERLAPHLDFEVDPLAFAAKGFSLHAGIRWHHFRADLGVFGMEMPGFLTKNDEFTTRFAGFGAKLDYRLFGGGDGPFVGISAGRARVETVHNDTSLSASHHEYDVSARIGYQFDIFRGFYAAPWVGLGYKFGGREVALGGDTLEKGSGVLVFPTIHLGYRFP
ncbi:MAG: hypothetical protein B7733_22555 [Myxococcales bacterium FL481]|nr:MAG: hypothetical protein B7733_22555 [Myxococcales bacterium FL481]